MILQFFVAYQDGEAFDSRNWVDKHERIVRHYITTWFPLDAFTIIVPCSFDIMLALQEDPNAVVARRLVDGGSVAAGDGSQQNLASKMSMLRVLRVLRLIKLVRLLKSSRMYEVRVSGIE